METYLYLYVCGTFFVSSLNSITVVVGGVLPVCTSSVCSYLALNRTEN